MGWSWDLNGPLWVVLMGLCLIAIVLGVVLIIKSGRVQHGTASLVETGTVSSVDQSHEPGSGGGTSTSSTASDAVQTLDEGYAAGEVTKDEYVEALEDLSASARKELS